MVMSSGETGRRVGETLASEKHLSTDKKEFVSLSKGARQSTAADPKRRIRLFAKYN